MCKWHMVLWTEDVHFRLGLERGYQVTMTLTMIFTCVSKIWIYLQYLKDFSECNLQHSCLSKRKHPVYNQGLPGPVRVWLRKVGITSRWLAPNSFLGRNVTIHTWSKTYSICCPYEQEEHPSKRQKKYDGPSKDGRSSHFGWFVLLPTICLMASRRLLEPPLATLQACFVVNKEDIASKKAVCTAFEWSTIP